MSTLFLEPVSESAKLPVKSTTFAACFDIHADVVDRNIKFICSNNDTYDYTITDGLSLAIPSGCTAIIPTGYKMQCPEGYSIKFYPRSGLGIKQGIVLANGTGVIDHDYQAECLVALTNTRDEVFYVDQADRICQMEIQRVEPVSLEVVTSLPAVDSNRTGGFGSTGK